MDGDMGGDRVLFALPVARRGFGQCLGLSFDQKEFQAETADQNGKAFRLSPSVPVTGAMRLRPGKMR